MTTFMSLVSVIFELLIFPGFVFLFVYALAYEYVDRKVYARFQGRIGPPFYQTWADFWKCLAKEEIVPDQAERDMFSWLPIVGFAAVATSFLYIPIWSQYSIFPFTGDVVVVAYLITLPAMVICLAGWYSTSPFSIVGGFRVATQLFGYEVPFLLGVLSPAVVAGAWSLTDIVQYQLNHVWLIIYLPLSFIVTMITLVGKLERVPFDTPTAEQELVAGPLTEYSGRRLALLRLMFDMEMVVGAALVTALFLGGFSIPGVPMTGIVGGIVGFIAFTVKTLLVVLILAFIKALFARLRIDQVVDFCYKWLAPMAVIQLLVIVALKAWGLI